MLTKWILQASFSRCFASSIPRNRNAEDWRYKLNHLNDIQSYSEDKLTHIIRSYYLIHMGSKQEGNFTNWSKDSTIISSLSRLQRFIPKLDKNQTVLLVRNLCLLGVRAHEIFNLIENHIVNIVGKELEPNDIVAIVQSMGQLGRDNGRFWEVIEEILHEVFENHVFDTSRCSNLLLGFKSVFKGSEALFDKIEKNLLRDCDRLSASDLGKIFKAYMLDKSIQKEFLDSLCKRATAVIEDFTNYELLRAITTAVKFGADEGLVDEIERYCLQVIHKFSLNQLSVIAFCYSKFKEAEVKTGGKRQEFLKEIERHYIKNNKNLKSDPNVTDYDVLELRLMWSLSQTGKFENAQLWNYYAKVLQANETLKRNNLDLVRSLQETLLKNGFR